MNMALNRQMPRMLCTMPLHRIRTLPQVSYRLYASDSNSSSLGSGIEKKGDKNARPVILEHAPPTEETEDVKLHNQEFEKRPDRAHNKIDPEDKDKVDKDFWKGKSSVKSQIEVANSRTGHGGADRNS